MTARCLLPLVALLLAACAADVTVDAYPPVETIVVDPVADRIVEGDTVALTVTLRDAGGNAFTGPTVSWSSSDAAVASVSAVGRLVAIAAGTVTLTASSMGKSASLTRVIAPGFAQVFAGYDHSCALSRGGQAFCWGWNLYGQLGDGTTSNRSSPRAVSGTTRFVSLSVNGAHTCGLTSAGAAYCWGLNASGRLGDGSETDRYTPSPVTGGQTFSEIDVGVNHTCAIATSGEAFCWGMNDSEQLGDGTTTGRLTPTRVTGTATYAGNSAGTGLATGGSHTCALTGPGSLRCWGTNTNGQLGIGQSVDRAGPTAVAGGLTFASVSAGASHTCAVTTSGAGYCWGWGVYGQLGTADVPDCSTTVCVLNVRSPAQIVGSTAFRRIAAGGTHTCGVATDGAAYCWGRWVDGALGSTARSTGFSVTTPSLVAGARFWAGLATGSDHSCGISANVVYCWGLNDVGQVGDGTTITRTAPTAVTLP